MASPDAIPDHDALLLQLAAFAGNEPQGSFLEVRPLKPTGTQQWVPVRKLRRAVELVLSLRDEHEVFASVNPRTVQSGKAEAVERCWCLVVDCDSEESVRRLIAFRPRPSLVVTSSPGKLHAYWPLRSALAPEWARRCNLRLACALRADRACADPARVMRAIGSVHRKGEPTPVRCVRVETHVFLAHEIVGALPDPSVATRGPPPPTPLGRHSPGTLAGLARSVREARPPSRDAQGQRNVVLNWAAFRAGEHVAAGRIAGEDAERELYAAAIAAGLDEAEARRTLESGLRAGAGA
jgi:hypothetical protein